MLYSEVLNSMTQRDGGWDAPVPEDWKQGRTIFGGLQVAQTLRAMRALVPAELPLRVLQATFVAPPGPDALTIQAGLLRRGKHVMHAEARALDGAQTVSTVTAVFGGRRESRIDMVPTRPAVRAESPIDFTFIPGVTPTFTQHFAIRWLVGGLPFSNVQLNHAVMEIGMTDSAKTGEEHVLAIADSIPPVALAMLDTRVNGSSLTWTLEMVRDRLDDLPLQGWRLDAEMTAGRHGYTNQSVLVWGPNGDLVALSRQCMVVFG
jgi:acyl-CoA thioesterase